MKLKQSNYALFMQRFAALLVHMFTASGAYIGALALFAIQQQRIISAFWLMIIAVLIDAVDGMFARIVNVKKVMPQIDGTLLDNIVDFLNYTIVPCFFLLSVPLIAPEWRYMCVLAIIFASSYQFTQADAKTADHFFKGFPSYWNIAIFYLYFWQMSQGTNLLILSMLAILSFVPIKYVYPSRLDYLTNDKWLRRAMLLLTIIWGGATAGLLWIYPKSNYLFDGVSKGYIILYVVLSLYRTWVPLKKAVS